MTHVVEENNWLKVVSWPTYHTGWNRVTCTHLHTCMNIHTNLKQGPCGRNCYDIFAKWMFVKLPPRYLCWMPINQCHVQPWTEKFLSGVGTGQWKDSQLVKVSQISDLWALGHKWDIYLTHRKFRGCHRRDEKCVRTRKGKGASWNTAFHTWHSWRTLSSNSYLQKLHTAGLISIPL